jgi:hypothetical protein
MKSYKDQDSLINNKKQNKNDNTDGESTKQYASIASKIITLILKITKSCTKKNKV